MLKAAASVEDGGTMTMPAEPHAMGASATDSSHNESRRIAAEYSGEKMKQANTITRFAYATGSRPLDGYTIKRGVGEARFVIHGIGAVSPVVLGGPKDEPLLLGAVTLESLGFMLNPLTRQLLPMRMLMARMQG